MADHRAQLNIEDGGRQWITMCDTYLSLRKVYPYYPPASTTILNRFQYLQRRRRFLGTTPYHSSISRHVFVQFQEYHMENRLPEGHSILEQLDLEGGGPRTAVHPEPVEGVVEGDGGGES